jgi:hypothetical protein
MSRQVRGYQAVELRGRDRQDPGARRLGDAGVVDQGVQPPERAHAFVDQGAGYALVVCGSDDRGGSPARRGDCRDGLPHGVGVTAVDDHAGAELAEQFGDRAADTSAAAGYHRPAPGQ